MSSSRTMIRPRPGQHVRAAPARVTTSSLGSRPDSHRERKRLTPVADAFKEFLIARGAKAIEQAIG